MSESTVTLSESSLSRLRELARWSGVSVEQALETSIAEYYDRQFWVAVNAGYAALRADPAAWAEEEAERSVWETTLLDGLDTSERWTEDGNTAPPTGQERAS